MEQQNMFVLADYIDSLCRSINNHNWNNSRLKAFFQELKQNIYRRPSNGYSILTGSDIIPAFILNNWTFREKIEDNLNNLQVLSKMIRGTFTSSIGRQISGKQISAVLELADSKFPIMESFLLQEPIDILLVNNTCCYANALYYINSDPKVVISDLIVLTHVADDRVSPEFALLHELGHMVHTRITQKEFVAPRSFEILRPVILKYTQMDIPASSTKWPKRWFAEWFAECFAIAVLHEGPYSSLDYHTGISDKHKDFIKTYMTVLFDTLEYNKLGKRTWEELKKYSENARDLEN